MPESGLRAINLQDEFQLKRGIENITFVSSPNSFQRRLPPAGETGLIGDDFEAPKDAANSKASDLVTN
jgi:hypothetical protein